MVHFISNDKNIFFKSMLQPSLVLLFIDRSGGMILCTKLCIIIIYIHDCFPLMIYCSLTHFYTRAWTELRKEHALSAARKGPCVQSTAGQAGIS